MWNIITLFEKQTYYFTSQLLETCAQCGGSVMVIACIGDRVVIEKIMLHLEKKGALPATPDALPETKAPLPANLVLLTTFGVFHDLWCCHQ